MNLLLDDIRIHESSYVDPNGFVFAHNGEIYRGIRREHEPFYRKLLDSDFLPTLNQNCNLVESQLTDHSIPELGCIHLEYFVRINPPSPRRPHFHHSGYWSGDAVARVPMYILCNGKTGVDSRLGESTDVAQTILDFFNIDQPLNPNARSLLSDGGKPYVTTLTGISFRRKEQFLNVYTNGFKYVFNLHPGYLYVHKEKFLNYFDTQVVARGPAALKSFDLDLNQILKDYRIENVSLEDFTKIR